MPFVFDIKEGYGVHSPFVFDLITSVIKEKAVYYDFERIEAMGNIREKERKLYRLLFPVGRILFLPECVVCWGAVSVGFHVSGGCFETDGVAERGCAYLGAEYTEQVKPGDLKGRKIDMVFFGESVRGGLG